MTTIFGKAGCTGTGNSQAAGVAILGAGGGNALFGMGAAISYGAEYTGTGLAHGGLAGTGGNPHWQGRGYGIVYVWHCTCKRKKN